MDGLPFIASDALYQGFSEGDLMMVRDSRIKQKVQSIKVVEAP